MKATEMKVSVTYVVCGDATKRSRAMFKPGNRIILMHDGSIKNFDLPCTKRILPKQARFDVEVHVPTVLANINHLERNISDQINQAIDAGVDGFFVRKNGSWSFSK